MNSIRPSLVFFAVGVICLGGSIAKASVSPLSLDFGPGSQSSNSQNTGASATVAFSFADEVFGSSVKLTLSAVNTTGAIPSFGAGASQGTLTAFLFDLPAGVSFQSGSFVAGAMLDTLLLSEGLNPFSGPAFGFGDFDIALSDDNNIEGGNPNSAIGTGASDTAMLILDLDPSGPIGSAAELEVAMHDGLFVDQDLQAAVRFMQVNAGAGSDKLAFVPPTVPPIDPMDNPSVPEPVSAFMWGALSCAAFAASRRRVCG